jgi:hypothetical protein
MEEEIGKITLIVCCAYCGKDGEYIIFHHLSGEDSEEIVILNERCNSCKHLEGEMDKLSEEYNYRMSIGDIETELE